MAATAKKKRTILDRLDPQNINPGLFPVYPSPEEASKNPRKPSHDIVAIPGLGAPEEFTWSRGGVHWLRDSNMLPLELPNARISVFQYKSQWFGKGSVDPNVDTVANQLLYELERLRGEDCKTPIIFVAHCLGGIILEQALLTARAQQDIFPSVFAFTVGSVFLGTPFNGTKTQKKAMVLARLAEQVGFGLQSNLLKLLGEDSRELKRLLKEFVPLCQQAQIRVFSFFEGESSDIGSYAGLPFKSQEIIVDEDSATWPGVERLLLDCDHFKLNKYTGPKDGNYRSVSNQIKVTAQRADVIINSRQKALLQMQVNDRTYRAILDALRRGFSDIDVATRGYNMGPRTKDSKSKDSQANQEPKAKQNAWIMEVEDYKTWSNHDAPQLLWVHGKAGTGQDSIATSVISTLKQAGDGGPLVASFFCDQGDENRRTLKGLLKILIYQIIDQRQDLAEHLLTDSKKGSKVGSQEFDEDSFTKTSYLWDRLQAMVRRASPTGVCVVIYGLEQLSGESLKEFFDLLKDIPANGSLPDEDADPVQIKWLLLSRTGRAEIKAVLQPRAMEIDIDADENSQFVTDALRLNISANVDELDLPAPLAFLVKHHTHARADDNSIYVSLVIQELKNVYTSGKSQAEIRALLESFPYGLTDMFTHVRKRVLDPRSEDIEYTKEILRCLILAQRAPTMRELAIVAGLPEDHRDDVEELKRYIVRCGAFVSLRGNEWDEDNMTVEWIDPSAQEHLEEYGKEELCLGLDKMQHGIIALRCLEHICTIADRVIASTTAKEDREKQAILEVDPGREVAQSTDQNDTTTEESGKGVDADSDHEDDDETEETEENEEFDALQYPVQYWIEHAKLAPEDVLHEIHYQHSFWDDGFSKARELWWAANEDAHPLPDEKNVSVYHIAAATGFASLIEYFLKNGWTNDLNKDDSLGFQPLYYACLEGKGDIMQQLLGAGVDPNYISDIGEVPAIYGASSGGHSGVVEALLDLGADIEAGSGEYGNALYAATEYLHIETMKLLLSRGANVNANVGWHRTILNVAAYNGSMDQVRLLLDSGADIDPDLLEYPYGSALGAAARRGHTDVVNLLLSRGWKTNKEMEIYRNFLTAAATYGHLGCVEALVEKEADITVLDQALQASSQKGQTDVVKCILDRTPTLRHERAFMLAAYHGHSDVLKLLFQRGIAQLKLDEALYSAVDNEQEATTELLLTFGADPNAEGPEYGTALIASAYDGTTAIMAKLLDKGADVNKQGGKYGTALQAAAYYGDSDNVKMLIDHHANINPSPSGLYGTPLQAACHTGFPDTVRLLLEHGAQVDTKGGGEYDYAIIAAITAGNVDAFHVLLEWNPNVTVRGGDDNTPVIVHAGLKLLKEDIEKLLDRNADINACSDSGNTALLTCANACDTEGLEFLLSRGANLHHASDKGTALYIAASEADAESCELLIDHGANVNVKGGQYGTPLQAACCAADLDTVKILLQKHAKVDLIGGEYGCALQAAAFSGDIEIVKELLEYQAELDILAGKYGYPLQAAAVAGHLEILQLLLDHGAKPNAEGGLHGFALLAAASKKDNEKCVELLLEKGANVSLEGGLLGSSIQAAAYGNSKNTSILEMLIVRGANVDAKNGKYGHALQAAALKADVEFFDALVAKGVDVNYRGGKYDTAIQAAAYADRLDLVERLIDLNADFRTKGGLYENPLTAAAIKGNKAVLKKFLTCGPSSKMLEEALVQAVYHRQTASVKMLLESDANVWGRHPKLGLALDALQAEQPDGYNSDDEADDAAGEVGEDEEEDDDSDESDDADESDDETDASVTALQLEEEVSEEVKIKKLLEDQMLKIKKDPTFQRSKTVRRRAAPALPVSLVTGVPPHRAQQSQQPRPLAVQSYSGPQPGTNPYGVNAYPPPQPPPTTEGYMPYRTSSISTPQTAPYEQTATQNMYQNTSSSYTSPPLGYATPPTGPSTTNTLQDPSSNTQAPSRYRQSQPPQPHPSHSTSPARQVSPSGLATSVYRKPLPPPQQGGFPGTIPQAQQPEPYYAPPHQSSFGYQQQQHPHHQSSLGSQPLSHQNSFETQPPPRPATFEDMGYAPYGGHGSSQSSFQSSQQGHSSQYSGNTNNPTSNSSQSSWFGQWK